MKKFVKFSCLLFVFISCSLLFIGCSKSTMSVEFLRFDIQQQQNSNDYCLDFTIKFDNKTDKDEIILQSDFYIEVNNEQKEDVTFLYEIEETYILGHYTAKSNEEDKIRVRVVSTIKDREYNSIKIKYKDTTIIEDNIYIYNTK